PGSHACSPVGCSCGPCYGYDNCCIRYPNLLCCLKRVGRMLDCLLPCQCCTGVNCNGYGHGHGGGGCGLFGGCKPHFFGGGRCCGSKSCGSCCAPTCGAPCPTCTSGIPAPAAT